jgi:hypothetical protein
MAVAASNITSGRDTDGNSTATTASVTPVANRLYLLTVTSRTNITTDPNIPTVTGNSLTWVSINSVVYDTTGASRRRVTLFRALGASPSSGTISVDFGGQNQTHVSWVLDECTGMDTSGTDGSGAIVQSATNKDETGTNTTFTVTLSAFSDSNNATYCSKGDVDSTLTHSAGSGFTLLGSEQGGTNDITTHTEFKASNDTTADWSASNFIFPGGVAIEIKMAATLTPLTWQKPTETPIFEMTGVISYFKQLLKKYGSISTIPI